MSKKVTTQDFINKAIAIHGDKFDYYQCVYTKAKDKVKISCKTHGVFMQKANNHLSGNGCPVCANKITLSTSDFISKAMAVHGDRYDYKKSKCVSYEHKITITCKLHGDFYQIYENHLDGRGCRKCGTEAMKLLQRKSSDQFIAESKMVHGEKYDYSKVKYIKNTTKVKIICRYHGEFLQAPASHIKGTGCPSCATTCFDQNKKCQIYIILSEDNSLMKIGVTSRFGRRVVELRMSTPFKIKNGFIFDVAGCSAKSIERTLHSVSESAGLSGFNGSTEWFYFDAMVINIAKQISKLNSPGTHTGPSSKP